MYIKLDLTPIVWPSQWSGLIQEFVLDYFGSDGCGGGLACFLYCFLLCAALLFIVTWHLVPSWFLVFGEIYFFIVAVFLFR